MSEDLGHRRAPLCSVRAIEARVVALHDPTADLFGNLLRSYASSPLNRPTFSREAILSSKIDKRAVLAFLVKVYVGESEINRDFVAYARAHVDEALERHPHAVLKGRHLVARCVNWEEKAANLRRLAKELDNSDPTAWLYSALHLWQENKLNAAIRDLETSYDKNDNRAAFRSRELLDADKSVRSANLAVIAHAAATSHKTLNDVSAAKKTGSEISPATINIASPIQLYQRKPIGLPPLVDGVLGTRGTDCSPYALRMARWADA